MTRVPGPPNRPERVPGAKHEMPPADLDFAFVPGCQTSGRKGEELVWFYAGKLISTFSYVVLRSLRFHPGPKPTAEGAAEQVHMVELVQNKFEIYLLVGVTPISLLDQ